MTRLCVAVLAPFLLMSSHAAISQTAPEQTPTQAAPATTDPTAHARLNLEEVRNSKLPTLFVIGDSTVRNGQGNGGSGQWGWGEPLHDYFDPAKINVVNRAIGGRSSRSYIGEGHWQEVLDQLKQGDFILVQFGHNDGGPLDDPARARGSIKGIGEETQEVDNPVLKRHETVHSYGWYMDKYVREGREKGATVIVCSMIPRKIWKDGHIVRNSNDYAGWAKEIAEREHSPFIDLNEIIAREYDAMGEAAVEPMFADPHTHTSLAGAQKNAQAVIIGLKLLHPDPLEKYFSAAAATVPGTMPPAQP